MKHPSICLTDDEMYQNSQKQTIIAEIKENYQIYWEDFFLIY